jgi:CheY-like chemotaxis protein
LVDEELAPYRGADGARIVLAGPSVFLEPDKAQTLALALHELATNSVKYGALSGTDGKLEVRWRLEGGVTTLSWRESGGPTVRAPSEQGFGTRIINASIKHQMGGDVLLDWRPEGLHCTLSLPSKAAGNGAAEATAEKMSNLVQLSNGSRKRVMLVEDEALVGMMMRDMLLDMGFFVVGPFCSVAEARGGVDTQQFDCAILDLNLRGEMVFPIAAVLEQRGKPFAFVTGYGPENIDKHFAHVAVMQKPIAREMLEIMLGRLLETDIPNSHGAAITPEIGAVTGI